MDVANCLRVKLEQILYKLKFFRVIRSYTLRIDFGEIDEDFRDCLREIDNLLKKCLEKIHSKPRRAEIRNVISELVRKKNMEQERIKSGFPKGNLSCKKKLNDLTKSLYAKKEKPLCTIKCVHCDQRFETKKKLKSHLLSHEKMEGYLCEFCGNKFENFSYYEFHILKIHHPMSNFKCEKCSHLYSLKEEFERHLETHSEHNNQQDLAADDIREDSPAKIVVKEPHHSLSALDKFNSKLDSDNLTVTRSQVEGEFEANDLGGGATGTEKLPEGENQESDKSSKQIPVPCEKCGRIFGKEKSLKKHLRLKHSDKIRKFSCEICKKSFFERGKLNRHVRIHQTGDFECSECSRTFCRMDNLRRHTKLSHGNARPFECKFCRKKFSLKHNRDAHEENVHNGVEIQCELCGQKCKNKITFRIHRKVHEENTLACILCPKTFIRKEQYRNHLKNKHKGFSPFQKLFDSFVKRDLDALTDVED